jgi:CHAT domain-containing protein/tetratricopeptide (TPR) repeat protein
LPRLIRLALAAGAAIVTPLLPSLAAQVSGEVVSAAGSTISATVTPDQQNEHLLRLRAGVYVRIVIEPHNCDLTVTLSEPEGGVRRVLHTPYGTRNAITVAFLVAQDETARLAVGTVKGTRTAGAYQVSVLEARASDPADQRAIQGQADFIAAESLKDGSKVDRLLALEKLRSAAATYQSIGRADERGESLRESGRLLMDLNESALALQVLNEALVSSKERKSAADEASTLNLLGEAEFNVGNTDRAEADLGTAATVRESLGDLRGQVQSLNNLAVVYQDNGDLAKALALHKRILPLRIKTGNRRGELETLLSLQDSYRQLGDIPEAFDSWRQARELLPGFDDPLLKGTAYLNAGGLYSAIGEKDNALDNYLKALEFARSAGDRQTEGILLQNLAAIYLSLGAPEKALPRLEESLSIARKAKDSRQEGRALEVMATIRHTLKDKQAGDLYAQSLEICVQSKDSTFQVHGLNGLGQVALERGDVRKAMEYFQRALELVRRIKQPQWEAIALANMGSASVTLGDLAGAAANYDQAYQIAERIGDRERERVILAGMARVKSESGHLAEARQLIERALAITEPLRAALPGNDLRSSYFASLQDLYALQIEILMKLHQSQPRSGFDVLALNASESARARGLLDRLALKGRIHEGLDENLVRREQELALELSGKTSRLLRLRLANSPKSAGEMADLQKEIADKENQYQELQVTIRRENPRFADLAQAKAANLDQIRTQVLDEKSVLLEYWLGEKSGALWVATLGGLTAYDLPGRAGIEAAARRYYGALTSRGHAAHAEDDGVRDAGMQLSRVLLEPAAALIAGKRLLVVADGILNYVPFSALPDPGLAGTGFHPLAGSHQIVMLPSASVLAFARQEGGHRAAAPKAVAILADPVFIAGDSRVHPDATAPPRAGQSETRVAAVLDSLTERSAADGSVGLARLPFTRQEADRIYAIAKASGSVEALDFQANCDFAMGPELVNYRIVHFATHGFLDDATPAWSGLVLSLVDERGQPKDGFLKLQDIYNLRLNADLVVLSACRTALGKDVKGEGIVGLSRGFMYAGAKRVLASLWKVDDFATAEFMTHFYRALLTEHRTAAEALRSAQLELSLQKRWADPYYWAGFVLQGEPN